MFVVGSKLILPLLIVNSKIYKYDENVQVNGKQECFEKVEQKLSLTNIS